MAQNKIELLGFYGSDLTHAQSAWTSTSRDLSDDKISRIPKLLTMLAQNGHHTPFEKSSFHFLVTVEQASHIHILKHRVGISVNGECLTGDAIITFVDIGNSSSTKHKVKIEDLFRDWNRGRPHQNTEKDNNYSRNRIKKRRLRVLDEKSGFFISSHIKDIWEKGVQDVYEILLSDGKKLKCTANHAIYTKEGYKSISTGLSKQDFVGVNGISVAGNGLYRDFNKMKAFRESNMSVSEIAEVCACSYHTVRKWLKIHGLKFSEAERNFQKGMKPWNRGVTGYKLNLREETLQKRRFNAKRGKDSRFWRGGVSSQRALIGSWTRGISKKVHEKYAFTCQKCGVKNHKLHAHHIIPVSTDESKAYQFDNLITVCQPCHAKIHYSNESELNFAKMVLSSDFVPLQINWGKNKKQRIGNKLRVHFEKIKSITYIGKEMTYDIEVEGINNNFVANNIVVHNSARYKELKEDKFYLPEDWNGYNVCDDIYDKDNNLIAFGQSENGPLADTWYEKLKDFTELGNKLYHECLKDLTPVLGRKRAKESARFFKTFNSQISLDVMFNWRSFYHFYNLRAKDDAQLEIHDIAKEMLRLIKEIEGNPFEHTIKAFNL